MDQENSLYRTVNNITAVIGVASFPVHYTAQYLVGKGIMDNGFIGGNLGDYGATLAMTAWGNSNKDPNDIKGQLLGAVYYASAWTAFELLQKAHLWPGTYDTKDILAFWAGSATAFLLGRLSSSEKVKNLVAKINPFSSKKSLEEKIISGAPSNIAHNTY
ncbi:hypothetical protein CEE44_00740 [Candidatus Woesearchaeota archaeon B3_Woes]|nr:MAG: hypothetical protein CEE44_00740 [Candidatus Woesearchaeota archaeon B3_Woes]